MQAYVSWPDFASRTECMELRASMMDLHWYINNARWPIALRELARAAYHAGRRLRSPPLLELRPSDLVLVIDTPGVGGLETLVPLLPQRPAHLSITLAVTDFIARSAAFKELVEGNRSLQFVNMDRVRAPLTKNDLIRGAGWSLARKNPRLLPALPLFLTRSASYDAAARAILSQTDARAVVLFNERMLPSSCFSRAARQVGTTTVAVQHGNFVENYLPVMVDHYLTWGRFHGEWLATRSNCRTHGVGSPRNDRIDIRPSGRWTLPADGPVNLVFFSQLGSATVSPEWIQATRRMIGRLAASGVAQVTVKLHPLDRASNWATIGPDVTSLRFLEGKIGLAEAVSGAHLMCSFYSTVLVEGLLHELPVVQLNPYPESIAGFPDASGIVSVRSDHELVDLVQRWRTSPADLDSLRLRQRQLCEGYFANRGHASKHLWDALTQILADGSQTQPTTPL